MDRIALYKAYFTEESKYFYNLLERYDNGNKISFNFWSGLLGIIWFCYRKMYVEALLILVLTFVFGFIISIIFQILNPYDVTNAQYIKYLIWLISFIILGFIGNLLYLRKSRKIVESIISTNNFENMDNSSLNFLREKGGTSLTSALICAGILVALQIFSMLNN